MRPRLVRWSTASLLLIFVVMSESFTNTVALVPTETASSAMAAADPNSAANTTQVLASFVVIKMSCNEQRKKSLTRRDLAPFDTAHSADRVHGNNHQSLNNSTIGCGRDFDANLSGNGRCAVRLLIAALA